MALHDINDIANGPAYFCTHCGGPMTDWSSETCAGCNQQADAEDDTYYAGEEDA